MGAKASDVTKAVRRIRDDERMIIVSCDVVFVSVLIQRLVADDVSCAAVVVASSLCEVYGMMVWLLLLPTIDEYHTNSAVQNKRVQYLLCQLRIKLLV